MLSDAGSAPEYSTQVFGPVAVTAPKAERAHDLSECSWIWGATEIKIRFCGCSGDCQTMSRLRDVLLPE